MLQAGCCEFKSQSPPPRRFGASVELGVVTCLIVGLHKGVTWATLVRTRAQQALSWGRLLQVEPTEPQTLG